LDQNPHSGHSQRLKPQMWWPPDRCAEEADGPDFRFGSLSSPCRSRVWDIFGTARSWRCVISRYRVTSR